VGNDLRRPDWPDRVTNELATAVAEFGAQVAEKLRRDGEPEDQLRAPTENLLRRAGQILGVRVVPIGEKHLRELGARPDYAIDVDGLRIG